MDDLMKVDLYELLNISITAEEKEIKKAYRKKALTCHPDKNPDNPQAAELFQQLSKALEVLTDKAARAAYDKVLNARKAAQVRHRELDSKRKKLKEDLEAREKSVNDEQLSAQNLQKEIERLRKEGSKLLEEENDRVRQKIQKEKLGMNTTGNEILPRLKVKWKCHKGDDTNGGYSQQILENIFKKYGQVMCLVSSKRVGSAILEFSTIESAQLAHEMEKGHPENPLALSWLSGHLEQGHNSRFTGPPTTVKGPVPEPSKDSPLTTRDYESLVLMKLRQAEERKKLIQQMMEDDD